MCFHCHKFYTSSPDAVGNPLGDHIDLDVKLLAGYDRTIDRMRVIHIGGFVLENESLLFDLLLYANQGMFVDVSDGLGENNSQEFVVELNEKFQEPVYHDVRRYNRKKLEFIDAEVEKMLLLGVIEPFLGDWSSAIVVAPKPGRGQQLRLCVDLRDVNEVTATIKYYIPNTEDIIRGLGGKAKFFIKLDMAKGFWQIRIRGDCKKYFAFTTCKGTWIFTHMPFGHENAPAVFQHLMNILLSDLLFKECFVYIDDVIVFGETEQQCIESTNRVLNRIFEDGLKFGGSKCEFLMTRVEVLGYVIDKGRLYAKCEKLQGL